MKAARLGILSVFIFCLGASAFAAEEPHLRLGMILPLSGDFALIGADCKQGIDLAVRESGADSPVDFVYGDSKADPVTSVGEFRKMTDAGNVAGVYVFRGPIGMALNPIAKQAKVPLLGGVGNKAFAEGSDYAFQIWVPSDIEGAFIAKELKRRNFRSVAMLTLEDDWTVSVSTAFRDAFKANGGSIVLDQSFPAKETDFRTLISQIKKANADVIFANLGISQIGAFLRQLREQGTAKQVVSNFWSAKKDVVEAAGRSAEGVMFSEMSLAEMPKFREAISGAGGGNPSGATLSAYVAAKLLIQAAKGMGAARTSADLYKSLLAQPAVELADLKLSVRNRIVDFPMTMKVIKGGKAIPVE